MRISLLALFLSTSFFSPAQSPSIKKLGVEHGLSSNYMVGITQDKQGFMWFATESGLNRFDGNQFRVFKKSNSDDHTSINSNELNKVLADTIDDIIWVATQRNGLNAFDVKTETFTYYTSDQNPPHGIATNDATNLAMAWDGNIWVSTYHFGVDYFDKKTNTFTHYNQSTIPELVSNHVWSVADDKRGNLYIGHVFDGLSILSIKSRQVKNFKHTEGNPQSLPGNEVNCIYIDSGNHVWVGTNNGLALYNPITEKFTVYQHTKGTPNSLTNNQVFAICEKDNCLWIGTTQGGVNILDLKTFDIANPSATTFHSILAKDDNSGLSNSNIRGVYTDSFNNMWIITFGGGVNFISSKQSFFQSLTYSPYKGVENSLSDKIASDVSFDGHKLWIGTGEGGIDVLENGNLTAHYNTKNSSIPDDNIISTYCDSEGDTWIGTANGFIIKHIKKTNQFKEINSVPTLSISVYCFIEDNKGNMWIGTNNGLHKLNLATNQTTSYYTTNSSLQDNVIRSISQDEYGNIWIGSFGQGLCTFDNNFNLMNAYNTGNGFPSNAINCIYMDKKNRIWVATRDGLVLFPSSKENRYQIFSIKDGLADTYISAIEEGLTDNLWFSTNSGITLFDTEESKFVNYNYLDGIPKGNFLPNASTKATNGTIFFGSVNGLCYFNPTQNLPLLASTKTTITDFIYYEKNISLSNSFTHLPVNDQTIELKHFQNTFSIAFNVLDYSLNEQTEYAYMLKGLEDKWENIGNEKQVTFRNLAPGNYEFMIKSRLRNQNWSDRTTSIRIDIKPPLWLTWWAKTGYVIIIVWILLFIIRVYKRKLALESNLILEQKNHKQEQELNNERLSFYTNIAHELRTPLTLIIGPLEDLGKDETLSAKHIKKVSLIHKSALRLLNLINQILEFRKTETHNRQLCVVKRDLADLVSEIGMKYEGLNQNPQLTFTTSIETDETHIYFDPEIVTIILDNLISNALKYTKKGEVKLTLKSSVANTTKFTDIVVTDTGLGIPTDEKNKIFNRYYQVKQNNRITGSGIGLSLVKNLSELHQGTVNVESSEGHGSSFTFSIETDNQYPTALHKDHQNEVHYLEDETQGSKLMLIVEDNADIREYIADSFKDQFEIIEAENGQTGIDAALSRIPDIVISDIMMPVKDGIELCKSLKEDVRTTHIPIILLTAKDSLQDKTVGYNSGADSYITKPFSAGLLQSRVANIMEARRKMASTFASAPLQKQAIFNESTNKLDQEFLSKVTGIIEDNLSTELINIGFIAEQLNMSNSTFYRKIKALTDHSPNEFIRKIKMHHAEKLLLTGKYTVSEIIYHVGINSSAYFRQCFKDEFGLTPTDYIKQFKEKK